MERIYERSILTNTEKHPHQQVHLLQHLHQQVTTYPLHDLPNHSVPLSTAVILCSIVVVWHQDNVIPEVHHGGQIIEEVDNESFVFFFCIRCLSGHQEGRFLHRDTGSKVQNRVNIGVRVM